MDGTTTDTLPGTWCLVGWSRTEELIDVPYSHRVAIWHHLKITSPAAPDLTAADGLVLTIASDLNFTESGDAAVPWYDIEGVWNQRAAPFEGMFVNARSVCSTAVTRGSFHGAAVRYHDGDTLIAEHIVWHPADAAFPERLLRTVTAITDEQAVERLIYAYHRAQ